jgi:hypothetical protein
MYLQKCQNGLYFWLFQWYQLSFAIFQVRKKKTCFFGVLTGVIAFFFTTVFLFSGYELVSTFIGTFGCSWSRLFGLISKHQNSLFNSRCCNVGCQEVSMGLSNSLLILLQPPVLQTYWIKLYTYEHHWWTTLLAHLEKDKKKMQWK